MRLNQSAIIFDRDNTLTQINPVMDAARAAQFAAIAPAIPDGAVMAHWAAWPGPWPRTAREEPEFWRAFWCTLAARYGFSVAAVHALQAVSMTYYTSFSAFPDALDCVHTLHSQGIRLAVLTNFQLPSVHLTLRHAGFDPHWFGALLSSGMLGVSKPDPYAYLATADALDLHPNRCIFVDDARANVEGACALGMRGVWLDRQGSSVQTPFEQIADLRSLCSLLVGNYACE